MSMWFKKLIEKFMGSTVEEEPTVTITSADPRHTVQEKVEVEVVKAVKAVEAVKVKYTFDQLMAMTKKEQIAFAKSRSIDVKEHWTKKNIAKEIVANS